jgi:hypothetical protein
MPLTKSGKSVLKNFQKEYGDKKGTSVFYASENSGKLSKKLFKQTGKKKGKK